MDDEIKKILEQLPALELKEDGLNDMRIRHRADLMCFALGIIYSPEAESLLKMHTLIAKLTVGSKG